MKTIFEKVDPKYIECGTGTCDHATHKVNSILPLLVVAAIILTLIVRRSKTHSVDNI
jgi:hypothetical protein